MTSEEIKALGLPDGWAWDEEAPCGAIRGDRASRDYRLAHIDEDGLYGSLHYPGQQQHHAAPIPALVAKALLEAWERTQ